MAQPDREDRGETSPGTWWHAKRTQRCITEAKETVWRNDWESEWIEWENNTVTEIKERQRNAGLYSSNSETYEIR